MNYSTPIKELVLLANITYSMVILKQPIIKKGHRIRIGNHEQTLNYNLKLHVIIFLTENKITINIG
jgi:hypothetical protein